MSGLTTNKKLESQEYFINMGPQHPSTHGVLRLMLTLDGETITNVEPHLGFIHRSIEKMAERDSYRQIIHLTDRMDYLSCHINNEAVALAIENPPAETRAFFRGKCLQKWPENVVIANWDSIVFDIGDQNLHRVPMMEPLRGSAQHVGDLIDNCETVIELIESISERSNN